MTATILVTGSNGYIGSHVIISLLQHDYHVVAIDNLCHSEINILHSIYTITNKTITFYPYDIRDEVKLKEVFTKHHIDKVIHLAALKSIPDSIHNPMLYYDNNVVGTLTLLKVMEEFTVNTIVFSSTAAVYDVNTSYYLKEESPVNPISPYGHSKLIIEDILKHCHINAIILRYFNPIGNHPSGLLLDINGANIMPMICKSVIKKHRLSIYNNNTIDGSGIRDYIHVMDVADAHIKVLNVHGYHIYNIGTGKGTSVLELVKKMESTLGTIVPFDIVPSRPGDLPTVICLADKIKNELGWEPTLTLDNMCQDVITALKVKQLI
ncbi:MAG TPA: UDP-glucose 4-epimerase GalE [Candidatus Saccharimonadales bacterium]|nr:UDP-glucose 4-epimerase GalE [Candidatus Saccharimonadales bacterium]